jgi:hypothetical protein
VTYRTIDFGKAGAAGAEGAGSQVIGPTEIDPRTEAAVRLIDEDGFESYIDRGITEIIGSVRIANPEASFAGSSTADAPDQAEETARENAKVQDVVEANRILQQEAPVNTDINPVGDLDWYGFELEETTPVILQAVAHDPPIDVFLEVFDAAGQRVSSSYCPPWSCPATRVDLVLDPGEYFVVMRERDNNASGPYTLFLQALVFPGG